VQFQYLYNLKMKKKSNFSFKAKQEEEDLVVLLLLNAMNRKPSIRSKRFFKRKRAYKRRRVNRVIEAPRAGEPGFVGPVLMDERTEEMPRSVTLESMVRERTNAIYRTSRERELPESDDEIEQPYHKLRAVD